MRHHSPYYHLERLVFLSAIGVNDEITMGIRRKLYDIAMLPFKGTFTNPLSLMRDECQGAKFILSNFDNGVRDGLEGWTQADLFENCEYVCGFGGCSNYKNEDFTNDYT